MQRSDSLPNGSSNSGAGRVKAKVMDEFFSNPSLVMLLREIKSNLQGCKTILDVGCGTSSPLRFLPDFHLTGLDGYPPAVEAARKKRTHDQLVLGDVTKLTDLFPAKQFDACIALDVIEHLHKPDGWRMAEAMERIARKRVIIFTPSGFVPQKSQDGDLQEHLSGWTADEMRGRGYTVHGMYGPKHMRGEYHRVKYKPRAFWVIVSNLLHILHTRRHPDKSAAIFCVKHLAS